MNPRNGYGVADLSVGRSVETAKTITDGELVPCAGVSTDVCASRSARSVTSSPSTVGRP